MFLQDQRKANVKEKIQVTREIHIACHSFFCHIHTSLLHVCMHVCYLAKYTNDSYLTKYIYCI